MKANGILSPAQEAKLDEAIHYANHEVGRQIENLSQVAANIAQEAQRKAQHKAQQLSAETMHVVTDYIDTLPPVRFGKAVRRHPIQSVLVVAGALFVLNRLFSRR